MLYICKTFHWFWYHKRSRTATSYFEETHACLFPASNNSNLILLVGQLWLCQLLYEFVTGVWLAKLIQRHLTLVVFSRWDQFAITKNRDWVKLWLIQVSNDTCYETVHPGRILLHTLLHPFKAVVRDHSIIRLTYEFHAISYITSLVHWVWFILFQAVMFPHGKQYQSCHDPDRETCKDKDFVEGSADYHVEGCSVQKGPSKDVSSFWNNLFVSDGVGWVQPLFHNLIRIK